MCVRGSPSDDSVYMFLQEVEGIALDMDPIEARDWIRGIIDELQLLIDEIKE